MRAFYGRRISGHMIETPEGYLICKEVPIARTGNQDYRGTAILYMSVIVGESESRLID